MTLATAHAVHRVLQQRADGELEVELACGCAVALKVAPDRVLEREDGTVYVVGKYPCPVGHAVRRPG